MDDDFCLLNIWRRTTYVEIVEPNTEDLIVKSVSLLFIHLFLLYLILVLIYVNVFHVSSMYMGSLNGILICPFIYMYIYT